MPRRSIAYAAYALLVAGSLGVAASNPLLFQKFNTLRRADRIPDLQVSVDGYVDVEALIRPIPLQKHEVLNVHPATRHRQTIVEGRGNCSQMVFGLAYQLERDAIDYQVIHLMTPSGLAAGDGHTVVRLAYRYDGIDRVGVVDVSFGAILTGAAGPLDVAEVEAAPVEGWGSIPINAAARFPYYHDEEDFVPRSHVGYVPASEVRRYYAFLDRVYFSFGNDRAEKYLFDALALLLGFLPEVFVPEYDQLLEGKGGQIAVHRGALGGLRLAAMLFPFLIGSMLLGRHR